MGIWRKHNSLIEQKVAHDIRKFTLFYFSQKAEKVDKNK